MRDTTKPEIGHVVNVRGSDVLMCVEGYDDDNLCCVWMTAEGRVERDVFRSEVLFNQTLEERKRIAEWERSQARQQVDDSIKARLQEDARASARAWWPFAKPV